MNRFSFVRKIVPLFLLVLLCGCKTPDKGYDLYIYNPADETTGQFEAACKAYTAKTGIRIKIGFSGSGGDYLQALRAELNSKNKPVIFSIREISELEFWRKEGFAQDLSHAGDGPFADLVLGIAPPLRLGIEGKTSYGIPVAVEAYGYIADRRTLAAFFGGGNEEAVIAAIKTASYDEWAAFVRTIERWISFPFPYRVFLSGRIYTFVSVKPEQAANLNGVFAVARAEGQLYGNHLVNAALNTAFASPGAAYAAGEDELRSALPAFVDYARALDLETALQTGKDGPVQRGVDPPANLSYAEALQFFSEGKAVFLGGGSRDYNRIAALNAALAAQLEFLPVKIPFRRAGGMTAEELNRSIPVFAAGYQSVNALASAAEKKLASDFLVWLYTSGREYFAKDSAFVPYYADPAEAEVSNALKNSVMDYMKTGDFIAAPCRGAPRFGDVTGRKLDEEYITKQFWTEADYEAIAAYAVNEWLNLK